MKNCRYSIFLLSIFYDKEMHSIAEMETHVRQCFYCSSWLKELERRERQIQRHEKCHENLIILEIFDVLNQRRDFKKLGWEPAWLGFEEEHLTLLSPAPLERLKFYLKFFWYGQIGIYVENHNFPNEVVLLRGRRYIQICPLKPQRIIESDGIFLSDKDKPIIEITLKMPGLLKESSITRKCRSLTLGSQSFIASFFKEAVDFSEIALWNHIKKTVSLKKLWIYLMHLNSQASYKKIARNFQVSPHQVATAIANIRKKLLSGWKL